MWPEKHGEYLWCGKHKKMELPNVNNLKVVLVKAEMT